MQTFEVMRESVLDQGIGEYRPGLVWAWREGEPVQVRATDRYASMEADYRDRLEDARRRGFKESELWAYYAQEGGKGYVSLRSQPAPVDAETMEALLAQELRGISQ